jgi:hypothetical protein
MKIIINENKIEKLKRLIQTTSVLTVVKSMSGYVNFKRILPDYFDSKEHKIELLNQLIESDDDLKVNGRIYMSDLTEKLILVGTHKTNNGTDLKYYVDCVKQGWATIQVWEFDENDELVDEDGYDAYDIEFDELNTKIFNQIFDLMVKYYL